MVFPRFLAAIRTFPKKFHRHHASDAHELSKWEQLPTELWLKIVAFLDKTDVASFSCASHAMRSLSLPSLFASLRLRVGYNILDNHSKERENEHVVLMKKSMATFRRLAERKPLLGVSYMPNELVRNLRIVSGVNMKIKHENFLTMAMWGLSNLRSLAWVGGTFPWTVADIVAFRCRSLVKLQITSVVDHPLRHLSALGAELQDIQFMDDCVTPCPSNRNLRDLFHQTCGLELAKLLTQHNQESIRRLSVYGPDPWQNEPQLHELFTGPTHIVSLAISGPNINSSLCDFLLQSPELESLALLDVYSLTFLPLGKDILSNLKDFKVHVATSTPRRPTWTISEPLIKFLGIHWNLRRFDISFCVNSQLTSGLQMTEEESYWFVDVVKMISELECLQAVGITFPLIAKKQVVNALNTLGDHSRSLETCDAIRIEGTWDAPMELITTKCRNCKFIALSDKGHCHCSFADVRPPSLTVEDIVFRHGLNNLEQAVLFDTIYDVHRIGASIEGGVSAEPWTQSRVRWRTEADFCCPDAHWLMNYRTIWNGKVAGLRSLPLF